MISILFKKKNNELVSFFINGHSGYAEFNHDIICSAVSALSISIANGIIEIQKIEADVSMKDGFLSLSVDSKDHQDIKNCQVLLQTMLLGVKSIEKQYSDYIKVLVEEV